MAAAIQKFRDTKHRLAQEKLRYREIEEHAREVAPIQDENGEKTALFERLMVDLAQFDTVDLAESALEEAQARVKEIHSDPHVVRLYEEKTKELESAREDLDDKISMKEKGLTRLERMKTPYVALLKETIETVDKKFTKYMSELGCVGSVALKFGDDDDGSFEDYAVEIMVSFRNGVKPTVLSSRVQSGGERSVSTIMYLMAMQDMMVSPFRCVDEINQGLDDRNERLVFKRIVENSTKAPGPDGPTDHCGQYWLITPKLLPNLTDMEVEAMNVVCIFNGKWNLILYRCNPYFACYVFLTTFLSFWQDHTTWETQLTGVRKNLSPCESVDTRHLVTTTSIEISHRKPGSKHYKCLALP